MAYVTNISTQFPIKRIKHTTLNITKHNESDSIKVKKYQKPKVELTWLEPCILEWTKENKDSTLL